MYLIIQFLLFLLPLKLPIVIFPNLINDFFMEHAILSDQYLFFFLVFLLQIFDGFWLQVSWLSAFFSFHLNLMKNDLQTEYMKSHIIQMLQIAIILLALSCSTNSQFVTVAIVTTNDIHGSALPTTMIRSDTGEQYKCGGLAFMGGLIDIIKNQNPGHTLFLDSGDQFQGGIESSKLVSSGKIMNDFYNSLELDASAIGNHQFDFGPSFLLPYYSARNSQNLAANIRSQKGQSMFFPKQKLSQIFEFKSGIRIGVIGLTTIFTPETTSAFADGKFPPYKFLEYRDIVIEESKKLKKNGADAVIISSHLGNDCNTSSTYGIWRVDTKQEACISDQASKLIEALPNGTIDGILQGHRHKFAHHFQNGIPYVGSINGGYYFNVLYLRFHKKTVYERYIEGPIPVCQKIFANLGTCGYLDKDKLRTAGDLVNWRFHNQEVRAHPKVQAIYSQEWLPKMKPYLVKLAINEVYLVGTGLRENELANLITNLMHEAVPTADFVLTNPGGFRTEWLPGVLQEQHFYNMFPFDNELISFDITGAQLIAMLRIIQSGPLGFYHSYGLKQTVSFQSPNIHKFISACFADDTPIDPQQTYRGMTTDFLLKGGDDFKDVMGKVYTLRNSKVEGSNRDLLRPKLIAMGTIQQGTLIDPNNPRLIVN